MHYRTGRGRRCSVPVVPRPQTGRATAVTSTEDAPRQESPADVFVVGASRSGTTWVQAVLSAHPSFVSPPETDLFSAFLAMRRRYDYGAPGLGLKGCLPPERFEAWCRLLWGDVREGLLEVGGGATRVLEKTPDHALAVELIRQLVPGARFVHVVRHPADVVRSMLEASQGWGARWAPSTVEQATTRWRRNVEGALGAATGDDMIAVRYEDLRGGAANWRPLLDHVGIEPGWTLPDLDAPALEAVVFAAPRGVDGVGLARERQEIRGFSYHDRTSGQRRELTSFERRYVESRCADLMDTFGYTATARGRWGPVDRIHLGARRAGRVVARARSSG